MTDWPLVLKFGTPSVALRRMRDDNVLPSELKALVGVPQDPGHHPEGDAFEHTCHVTDCMADIVSREELVDERRDLFMLAALCHDMGKATTTKWNAEKGKWTAWGHDEAGVPIAETFLRPFRLSPDETEFILKLVRWHMAHCRPAYTEKAVRKLARELQPAAIADLLLVMEADCGGRPPLPKGLPAVVTEKLIPIAAANGWLDGPDPADRRKARLLPPSVYGKLSASETATEDSPCPPTSA